MGAETPDAGTDYLLAELEHRITTLTLNRPESRNALTGEIIQSLPVVIVMLVSELTVAEANAQDAISRLPTYFPNTEEVMPDEMRITALGTGLPTPLTISQKSTSWMVEFGNGDVVLFDIGTGSMVNLFGLRPDFSKMDKIFLSHLHSDHFGDLDAFIVGSWLSGRYKPLHVFGGSGSTTEFGTKAAVDSLMNAIAWDIKGRTGVLPDAGGEVIAHEFDYKKEDQMV